jgi:hypothetical protein
LVSPSLSPESSTKPTSEPVSSGRKEKETGLVTNPLDPAEPQGSPSDDEEHIDKMVPPKIMRLTQHYHNLIYIRYFWESIGQQPPQWIKGEMQRADGALRRELEKEEGQGGLLHRSLKDETG